MDRRFMPKTARDLAQLQQQVIACTRCANLIAYCRKVAKEKRRMYRDCDYWGKPVPSFGDPGSPWRQSHRADVYG
jgi:hypothetical protein